MKRIITFALITAVILMTATANTFASAEDLEPKSEPKWETRDSGLSNYSIEDGVFIIENTDYTHGYFHINIPVEPDTAYRISVMISTENYKAAPDAANPGALLSVSRADASLPNIKTLEASPRVRQTEENRHGWQKYTRDFNSGEHSAVDLYLRSGSPDSFSTGTVRFKDIKLEKGIPTTHWNILALNFTKIDAVVDDFRGSPNHRFKSATTDAYLGQVQEHIKRLPKYLNEMTGGMITAEVDMYTIKKPIASLSPRTNETDYRINPEDIADTLNLYMPKKEYHQIIITLPAKDIGDWTGLAARRVVLDYGRRHWSLCTNQLRGKNYYLLLVHEIIHPLEEKAGIFVLGENNRFHNYKSAAMDAGFSRHDAYAGFMRNSLPEIGEGLPPEVFIMHNYVEVCIFTGEIIHGAVVNNAASSVISRIIKFSAIVIIFALLSAVLWKFVIFRRLKAGNTDKPVSQKKIKKQERELDRELIKLKQEIQQDKENT